MLGKFSVSTVEKLMVDGKYLAKKEIPSPKVEASLTDKAGLTFEKLKFKESEEKRRLEKKKREEEKRLRRIEKRKRMEEEENKHKAEEKKRKKEERK